MAEIPEDHESVPSEPALQAVRWRILRQGLSLVLVTAVCYSAGLAAGMWGPGWDDESQAMETTPSAVSASADATGQPVPGSPARTAAPVIQSAANAMSWGDSLLMAGNAASALRQYELVPVLRQGRASPGLRYRVALCAETLGDFDRALTEYRQLLDGSGSPRIAAAAQLGQVRIWLQLGRPALAKQLLWKIFLFPAEHPSSGNDQKAPFSEQLAQLLARLARTDAPAKSWQDRGIVDPPLDWSAGEMLLWIAPDGQSPASPENVEPQPATAAHQHVETTLANCFTTKPYCQAAMLKSPVGSHNPLRVTGPSARIAPAATTNPATTGCGGSSTPTEICGVKEDATQPPQLVTCRLPVNMAGAKFTEETEETEEEDQRDAVDPTRPTMEVLRRIGPRPEEIYVRVVTPDTPSALVVERLLQQAELELHWQDATRDVISGHTVHLHVHDLSLAMILDGMLDPLDLMWEARDGVVTIQSQQEALPDSRVSFRRALAERMLRHVLTRYPHHELTDEAYWALGNLKFAAGQLDAAILQYEQYVRQFPQSPSRTGVYFNLAKAYLLRDQRGPALQHFYNVVDGAISETYVSSAYLYIGRLHMEEDLACRACKPLTRAVALAGDPDEEAVTALEAAVAYLLCDNPHSANRVLMDHRAVLAADPFRDRAALMAAIARFRAAATLSRRKKEARELIQAITHVQPQDLYGAQGYLLLADAGRSIGLVCQSQTILEQGLQQVSQGAIRHRMMFGLAECYLREENREACRDLLHQLVSEGDDQWQRRATLELAELAFQMRDDDACQELCSLILENTPEASERKAVLLIAGRLLERQGNYHGAALCFAGVSPYSQEPLDDRKE